MPGDVHHIFFHWIEKQSWKRWKNLNITFTTFQKELFQVYAHCCKTAWSLWKCMIKWNELVLNKWKGIGHKKKKNCKPYKWHNMINLFADKANNIFHCRFSKLKFISTCRCSFLYREAIKGPLWIKIVIKYFLVNIN